MPATSSHMGPVGFGGGSTRHAGARNAEISSYVSSVWCVACVGSGWVASHPSATLSRVPAGGTSMAAGSCEVALRFSGRINSRTMSVEVCREPGGALEPSARRAAGFRALPGDSIAGSGGAVEKAAGEAASSTPAAVAVMEARVVKAGGAAVGGDVNGGEAADGAVGNGTGNAQGGGSGAAEAEAAGPPVEVPAAPRDGAGEPAVNTKGAGTPDGPLVASGGAASSAQDGIQPGCTSGAAADR